MQDLIYNSKNVFNLLGTTNQNGAGSMHSGVDGRLIGDGQISIHSIVCHHENIGVSRLER